MRKSNNGGAGGKQDHYANRYLVKNRTTHSSLLNARPCPPCHVLAWSRHYVWETVEKQPCAIRRKLLRRVVRSLSRLHRTNQVRECHRRGVIGHNTLDLRCVGGVSAYSVSL